MDTKINIQEKSNMIWSIADILRNYYKPHEYGKIILPMTVLKRFDDVLALHKEEIINKFKFSNRVKDTIISALRRKYGFAFYNFSDYDFIKLAEDPDHIKENFDDYINHYSDNVQDIINNFNFKPHIEKIANNGMLYEIIKKFNEFNFKEITAVDMGYIFEDLVRRFSESYGESAGSHFTARDIIYLMTDLLLAYDKYSMKEKIIKNVYDMTMGTSQMLSCMTERIKSFNESINVDVYGQELNPETYAIAKSDILIRGVEEKNIRLGNTLSDDQFYDYENGFDYIISNPPFGVEWKVEEKKVKEEYKRANNNRFMAGLPKISDGQMLFDLNGISKLKSKGGRMAIIHNGSPLFTGAAGSGESEIRRFLIENDMLETIIQLPASLFYNTSITTYVWIMTKEKLEERKGKIQLINASEIFESRRKNIGNKRADITEECREFILKVYKDFKSKDYTFNDKLCQSKIFNNNDFGYNRIQIETPLYDEKGKVRKKGKKIETDSSKRDYENVPLNEDIYEYFEREIKPYSPDSFTDDTKTKIGYEIPFTRYFYKYEIPESSDSIANKLKEEEKEISNMLDELFN